MLVWVGSVAAVVAAFASVAAVALAVRWRRPSFIVESDKGWNAEGGVIRLGLRITNTGSVLLRNVLIQALVNGEPVGEPDTIPRIAPTDDSHPSVPFKRPEHIELLPGGSQLSMPAGPLAATVTVGRKSKTVDF